jgi:hypothetical protein
VIALRCSQCLDRCRGHDPFHSARQLGVQGDERVRLQLGECDVLGVVGRGPPQLLGDIPGPTPEHCVAEEADRQRPDAGEPVDGDIRRDLARVNGLVQGRQRLGAQERRRKQLVLGRDLDPSLANWRATPQSITNLVMLPNISLEGRRETAEVEAEPEKVPVLA